MPRSSLLRRASRLVAALWVTLVLSGISATHVCPLHDHIAPAAAHDAPDAHAHHAMAHDGKAQVATGHDDAPTPEKHGCTCIGDCCAVAVAVLTAEAPRAIEAAVEVAPRAVAAHGTIAQVPALDHEQPPAHAPPTVPA